MFGFKYVILVKALDYRASHPDITFARRLIWMFPRIFLCGVLYGLSKNTLSVWPIVNSFIGFFTLTTLVHKLPQKYVDDYYQEG